MAFPEGISYFASLFGHATVVLFLGLFSSKQSVGLVDFSAPFFVEMEQQSFQARPAFDKKNTQTLAAKPKDLSSSSVNRPSKKESEVSKSDSRESLGASLASLQAQGSEGARIHYVDGLRSWIEHHKTFPTIVRRLGISGQVSLRFEVDQEGFFHNVSITRSSSHQILDKTALALLKKVGSYRPFPKGWDKKRISVKLPIQYILNKAD